MNWPPHGFTPASVRSLCAMDKEYLGRSLQDCLWALGTGQGADPPAAPAPQATPLAPHLADGFPLQEEVLVHNTCNSGASLAGVRDFEVCVAPCDDAFDEEPMPRRQGL